MHICRAIRLRVLKRWVTAGIFSVTALVGGCLDSDLFKEFRQSAADDFASGFSTLILDPYSSGEAGLREAATGFFEGIGAIIEPRTPAYSKSRG